MQGKTVIVTGASTGIGQGVAKLFAEQGAELAISYNQNKKGAQDTLALIEAAGGKGVVVQGDLSKPDDAKRLFKKTLETYNGVDVLVNVAGGVARSGELQDTNYEDWLRVFDDNLFSTVLCAKEAFTIMRSQAGGGKIVNIASVLGERHGGRQGAIAYSAAKAAVINFTQTLAKQAAPNVLVNAVSPGRTYTPYYETMEPEKIAWLKSANTIGRFITVEEIAKTVLFVAGNEALSGEVVTVGGGFFSH